MSLDALFAELDLDQPEGPASELDKFLKRFGKSRSELRNKFEGLADNDPSQLSKALEADQALELLSNFFLERSPHEFALLCHAALPASITPDLLQTLRASLSFQGYAPQWEDAIRLLLSQYFRPVGPQTYEMDLNTRRVFVKCLELCYGTVRAQEIAHLLLYYYKETLADPHSDGYELAKVQQITAYAYLDPELSVRELTLAYGALSGEENSPERMRLAALISSLSDQLSEHKGLIQYAESWRAQIHEDTASLRASLAPLIQGGKATGDALKLPVPQDMYHTLKEEFRANDPLWEARQRIQAAFDSKSTTLDLSGLAIGVLPPELTNLANLTELDLSNNSFVVWPDSLSLLMSLKVLKLNNCGLRVVNPDIVRLIWLESLELKGNLLRRLPPAIQDLEQLEEIHLQDNQFGSLPFDLLESSIDLFLQGNPLPEVELPEDLPFDEGSAGSYGQQSAPESQQFNPPPYQQSSRPEPSEEPAGLRTPKAKRDRNRFQQGLADYQRGLQKGPQKMAQLLFWGSSDKSTRRFFNSLNRGKSKNARHNEAIGGGAIEYQYGFGENLGLGADLLIHTESFTHHPDEVGIQSYCTDNTVIVLALQQEEEMERWIARLPKDRSLKLAVFTTHTDLSYLMELRSLLLKRYNDRIWDLAIINPDSDLGKELLLDFLQEASEVNPVVGPGRAGFEDLIRIMENDQPINEKEFDVIDIPSHYDLSFQNSGFRLVTELETTGYLSQIEKLNATGSHYFSAAGLRKTFLQTQNPMNHPYMMGFNDISNAAERYFSSKGMAPFLRDKFIELGWLKQWQEDKETEEPKESQGSEGSKRAKTKRGAHPEGAPEDKTSQFLSYSAISNQTEDRGDFGRYKTPNIILDFQFDSLPIEIKERVLLLNQSLEAAGRWPGGSGKRQISDWESEEYIVSEPNRFILFLTASQTYWEFDFRKHSVTVSFDNTAEDQELSQEPVIMELMDSAVASIPATKIRDIWINRMQDEGQPDKGLHYPTLKKIYDRGKLSYILRDQFVWHSLEYALGITNSISHTPRPSVRKTLLFYAREDFAIATRIIESMGSDNIRLLPYTPDLYRPLENPALPSLLEEIDTIVLLFTENFVMSPQAMGYWHGTLPEPETDYSLSRLEEVGIRSKTVVVTDLKLGDEHVEDWIKTHWEKLSEIPLPTEDVTDDPFRSSYRIALNRLSWKVLDDLEELTDWIVYQERLLVEDMEKENWAGLSTILLENSTS